METSKYQIKIKTLYLSEARHFLLFLQNVANRSKRHARIKFKYLGRGTFTLYVENKAPGLDTILQELLLNRGLYYYSCTFSNKEVIISNIILPIFKSLIDERFSNPQSRFLRKHILGKHAQTDFIPVDFKNKFGTKFEVIYRKWDIGIISNKDYVIELDTLLHQYTLESLGHKTGDKSDPLPKLLQRLSLPFELHGDFKEAFLLIHSLRTGAVHRLELPKSKENLAYASTCIYNFFNLIDELKESNVKKVLVSRGKKYPRRKYGKENWNKSAQSDSTFDWGKLTNEHPCHDCFIKKGFYHVHGCDVEQCPKCEGQLLSCNCKFTS